MTGLEQRLRATLWPLLKRVRKTVTIATRQGRLTVATTDDAIGKSLFCEGQYELDLVTRTLAFLRERGRLPPRGQGTMADVGANNGVISIGALTAGELDKAIAIEPDPGNVALLQRNVEQNGLTTRVTCVPRAVSSAAGKVEFELSDSNLGDHRVRTAPPQPGQSDLYGESRRAVITVEAMRLDDLLSGRDLSLIWMDVQGHEGHVLAGADRLISLGIPVVCEVWPYGLRRAGTSDEAFASTARRYWKEYWVLRDGAYVRAPIEELPALLSGLTGVDYANVVFM